MSKHIEAPYGQRTYALLDKCVICGKPYQGCGWHTVRMDKEHDLTVMLLCEKCRKERCKEVSE